MSQNVSDYSPLLLKPSLLRVGVCRGGNEGAPPTGPITHDWWR
jgi:hypothetical protein